MTGVITNDAIAQKLFLPDPEECYRIIRQTRWPEGVTCPHCDSKEVQKNGHTPKGARLINRRWLRQRAPDFASRTVRYR